MSSRPVTRTDLGPDRQFLGRLSIREREIAVLIARACSNRDIARALSISEKTVEHHITSIFRKLGLRSRAQLIAHYLT